MLHRVFMCLLLIVAVIFGEEISVHFIDVGQADAILIQSANNAVLIDGGDNRTRDQLIRYLRSANVRTLDYVVATHPHADHIGGLPAVIRALPVRNVIMPNVIHTTRTFENLIEAIEQRNLMITVPSVGDTLRAGVIQLVVLAPDREYRDLNNMSVVLRMIHGNTSFLFTGDAERESEAAMVAGNLTLQSNVLKVGHHGSRTSTTARFLDAVRPSIAVIMCGEGNRYNHPHDEIINRLNQPRRNITTLRTDRNGTIVITTDGANIRTRKERN